MQHFQKNKMGMASSENSSTFNAITRKITEFPDKYPRNTREIPENRPRAARQLPENCPRTARDFF